MGLFPAMQKAHAAGVKSLFDLSTVCAGETNDCTGTLKMVGAFLDICLDAYESGLYTNGVVYVACNSAQLRSLTKLQGSFQEYTGIQAFYQTNDGVSATMDLPMFKY